MMAAERWCGHCGLRLADDAHPQAAYCDSRCRSAARERRKAQRPARRSPRARASAGYKHRGGGTLARHRPPELVEAPPVQTRTRERLLLRQQIRDGVNKRLGRRR